jgi:rubrerythrin
MGGRGRDSKLGSRQFSLDEEQRRREIKEKLEESARKREEIEKKGGTGGFSTPHLYKKCACCGKYSLPAGSEYEECPICGWIDDPYQNQHPDSPNGRNSVSLNQARAEYVNNQLT